MKRSNKAEIRFRKLIRDLLQEKMRDSGSGQSHYSLTDALFEDAEELAGQVKEAGGKPITLVVLYGPPAAGKGAAKSAIGDFIGAGDGAGNFEDWLKDIGDEGNKHFQEEDAAMVSVTTGELPAAVFKELVGRVAAGETFEDIASEYFHVNEKGKKFELSSILSAETFNDLKEKGDAGAQEFQDFSNTKAFFTQARGFSKPLEGLDDKTNKMMGPNDGTPTLGVRAAAAGRYIEDVTKELKGLMGSMKKSETPYATVYLADQSGESTSNTDRIAALGGLKEDPEFDALKIIGVYIHQPAARTRMANLHRAATGGRRVAQTEVDDIFKAGPELGEDGTVKKLGTALTAMKDHFDQVHLYHPENPFDPKDIMVQGVPIGNRICEPLGPGRGHLDIEGCPAEAEGPATSARSLAGMEKYAVRSAKIPDEDTEPVGGGIPAKEDLEEEEKGKIVQAFEKMGFSGVTPTDLDDYLQNIDPPKIRKGGKHGRVPWSVEMFGDEWKEEPTVKGRSPEVRVTLKDEGIRTQNSKDDLILERWQKLAGILD